MLDPTGPPPPLAAERTNSAKGSKDVSLLETAAFAKTAYYKHSTPECYPAAPRPPVNETNYVPLARWKAKLRWEATNTKNEHEETNRKNEKENMSS
jgi:hypothetical protein